MKYIEPLWGKLLRMCVIVVQLIRRGELIHEQDEPDDTPIGYVMRM